MSIILDALRRGRRRQTLGAGSNTAQTDAVLHTLGYDRFNPRSPFNRFKRLVGLVALSVAFALVLWGTVIWITQAYLRPAPSYVPAASTSATQPRTAGPSGPALQPTAPATSAVAPQPDVPGAATSAPRPVTRGASVDQAAAEPIVRTAPISEPPSAALSKPSAPVAVRPTIRPAPRPPAPATARRVTVPFAVPAPTPAPDSLALVQNSRRASVSEAVPTPPTGAPSRTALSVSAAPTAATITTSEDHFGRAVIYQRAGDFENALVQYKQLLQRDDLNAEAHNNLGLLYRDKGLLEDAINEFRRAIAIEPRYARARNNLGVVYLTQRKLDAAAAEFHAALAIDPSNVESLVNLSTVEKEAGRREDARSALVSALELDARNAEAHYNFALLEDEAGNREQALLHYRAFLQHGVAGYPSLVAEVRKRVDVLTR